MSMKAVAITVHGSEERLQLLQVAKPVHGDNDLLVKVHAFALNPVDTKIRRGAGDGTPVASDLKILGWDGSGVIETVGANVQGFKVGDEVWFAGSIARNGCNAEYVAIDYRLVSLKPRNVNHLVAASMPLALLTAWEAIEEKFHVSIPEPGSKAEKENSSKVIVIVAGAGGVGSIAIQLAKNVFKIGKVVATAGRANSTTWCRNMGADLVIDRTKDWKTQLTEAGINGVDYILSCTEVDDILDTLVAISHPWGHICGIVSNVKPLNMTPLFNKALTFSWEFMGARPIHHYQQERHGQILSRAAGLVDNHIIKSWVGTTYDHVTLENMRAAHILQQSGTAIGKIAFNANFEQDKSISGISF